MTARISQPVAVGKDKDQTHRDRTHSGTAPGRGVRRVVVFALRKPAPRTGAQSSGRGCAFPCSSRPLDAGGVLAARELLPPRGQCQDALRV